MLTATQILFARILGALSFSVVPISAWAQSAPLTAQPDRQESIEAPAQQTSRVQLTQETQLAFNTLYQFGPITEQHTDYTRVSGASLSATIFSRRLVDDGTPRSLQPFLQRTSTFWLQARGSEADTTATAAGQAYYKGSVEQVGASLAVDAYVRDFLILSGSAGINLSSYTGTMVGQAPEYASWTELLPVSVGVGLRFQDTRIDVSYEMVPMALAFWGGGVAAAVRTVAWQRVDLYLRAALIYRGAAATAGLALYPTRNFGIFGSLLYGHGSMDVVHMDLTISDTMAARVGISYWAARSLSASLSYAPTSTCGHLATVSHVFTLALDSRL